MDAGKEIRFTVNEGDINNYIDSFLDNLGGNFKDNEYTLNNRLGRIDWMLLELIPGFQLVVGGADMKYPVFVERIENQKGYDLHISVLRKGVMHHQFEDEKEVIKQEDSNDMFISNGSFPLETILPTKPYQAIGFKIKKETFYQLFPNSNSFYEELFPNNSPLRYHLKKTNELELLQDELFHLLTLDDLKKPLIMSKGLELFAYTIKSIQNLIGKDELYGLHIEDYNRLLEIKERLQSDFEDKIVLEEIASEFGISVSKLKRDFKTVFNTSVYQYHMNYKMDEAYKLLQSGKYTVSQVGYDLGYKNLATFSRMFKKVKGMKPTDVTVIK
ncbi:AraC family transcriptional regulator [Flammeovirga sp. OC4]|uniref:helix-turn-helix domain-containing protein n=1 Tax=Flammeovirga sp. OC4 TaxID=1382345 RepID=UPI000693C7B9|nr:AraC family transcriptional regulator [Flammeovirga sp. OC4]